MGKSGMSLVTVLVAATLLGLIAAGLSSALSGAFKGKGRLSQGLDLEIVRAETLQVLSDSELCAKSLVTSSGSTAKYGPSISASERVAKIVQPVGSEQLLIAEVGEEISPGLKLSAIDFQAQKSASGHVVPPKNNYPNAGQVAHFVELILRYESTNAGAPSERSNERRPFRLVLVTDSGSNKILSCGLGIAPASPSPSSAIVPGSVSLPGPSDPFPIEGAYFVSGQVCDHPSSKLCCNTGDYAISARWEEFAGEKSPFHPRKSGECIGFQEGIHNGGCYQGELVCLKRGTPAGPGAGSGPGGSATGAGS